LQAFTNSVVLKKVSPSKLSPSKIARFLRGFQALLLVRNFEVFLFWNIHLNTTFIHSSYFISLLHLHVRYLAGRDVFIRIPTAVVLLHSQRSAREMIL